MLNHGLNHGLFLSLFKFLFEIQAILPETSPFLSAQMAVLSSFFQMFIVLGMYNFALGAKLLPNSSRDKKYHQTIIAQPCRLKDVSVLFFLWFQEIMFNAVIISFAKMSFKYFSFVCSENHNK